MQPVKSAKRKRRYEDPQAAIKAIARAQMAENGTAALSLRAIAAQMGMSAPSLYNYYPDRDALITALIVDAFNALADALIAARDRHADAHAVDKLIAVLMAYRGWAVDNPTEFQLIYGTPIPHYHAPREVTVPVVVRGFAVIIGLVEELLHSDRFTPCPPYDVIPETTRASLEAMIARDGYHVTPMAVYLGIVGWTQLHGLIALEAYHHLQPVVGDTQAHYQAQMLNMLRSFGIRL
ncbi:MAG: TetR/AcrR family transcriptional regulator [Anaerolineae bacterium]